MTDKKSFTHYSLLKKVILSLVLSFVLVVIYLNHKQSLVFLNRWEKGSYYELGGYNQELFFNETKTLDNNRLNLGEFGGFQQAYYKKILKLPIKASFDACFNKNGFFYIFFRNQNNLRYGFRLSRFKYQPSHFVIVAENGRFIRRKLLQNLYIKKINHIVVEVTKDFVTLSLNQNQVKIPIALSSDTLLQIGFQGGIKYEENKRFGNVWVDNLDIVSSRQTHFNEDFSWNLNLKTSIPFFIFFVILFTLLQFFLTGKTIVVIILNSSILFLVLDFFFLKGRFFDFSILNRVGKYDSFVFSEYENKRELWYQKMSENNDAKIKILFVGGSTTEGIGALFEKDAWVKQLEDLCQREMPQKIYFLNAGISRASTIDFELYYQDLIDHFKPQYVFFHVGINDLSPGIEDRMKKYVDENSKAGIKTILSAEFVFYDFFMKNKYYTKLKSLAQKNKDIIWINSYKNLRQEVLKDRGIYWADGVHLSSYGQQQFAELLFLPMLKILKLIPKTK